MIKLKCLKLPVCLKRRSVNAVLIENLHSAGHFLLCCTRYKEARTELSETVSDILESVKGRKQLTESLLLANQSDNITRKQDRYIKAARFQFIIDTQRKL